MPKPTQQGFDGVTTEESQAVMSSQCPLPIENAQGKEFLPSIPAGDLDSAAKSRLLKIVSGGQTGADRAALDCAMDRGIPHGGWCPKGRMAEDGVIDARYTLQELEGGYKQRTRQNVIDSDGTLILNLGELEGGSLNTLLFAERFGKPCCVVQLDAVEVKTSLNQVREWIRHNHIRVLNVAGPRESKVLLQRLHIVILTNKLASSGFC